MDINKALIADIDKYYKVLYQYNFIDYYEYGEDKFHVPRVTNIIGDVFGAENDGLANFANQMGYKHINYKSIINQAAEKGTIIHKSIEDFITRGIKPKWYDYPNDVAVALQNAFAGFLGWWQSMNMQYTNIQVLGIEKQLVCPYYGGTADMLLNMDGKNILFDFKTSSKMHFEKYFAQLAAYKYAFETYENIKIDGLSVLMLNKNEPKMTEYKALMSNPNDREYIKNATRYFLSMLHTFYAMKTIQLYNKKITRTPYTGVIKYGYRF